MPDIEDLIEHYLQGELSSGNKEVLLRQIKENSENRKLIFREKDIRIAIQWCTRDGREYPSSMD